MSGVMGLFAGQRKTVSFLLPVEKEHYIDITNRFLSLSVTVVQHTLEMG
jgi:hypothetical protein